MALDYGYVITIDKNGVSYPDTDPTNQWQKKEPGQQWADITGATQQTYTVQNEDTFCDIRLKQIFEGAAAYSNSLTVTSVAPGCPFPDPTDYPHINATSAENGDTLTMDRKLVIPGIAESNYTPTWYGILSVSPTVSKEAIQYGGFTLDVTDEWAQKYEYIYVNQRFEPAASLDPLCVGFSPDSMFVPVSYVPIKSFGNTVLSVPSVVEVGEDVTVEVNYDGDLIHYTAVPEWPADIADFVSENKLVSKYSFVIKYHTPGSGEVKATLTSTEIKTIGENPVSRAKNVEAKTESKTLGIVTIEGEEELFADEYKQYEIKWTGNAPVDEVTYQWITDGEIEDASLNPVNAKWSSDGSHFIWAQVKFESDTQMPMHDVAVSTPPWQNATGIYHIIIPDGNTVKFTRYDKVYYMDGSVYAEKDTNGFGNQARGPKELIVTGQANFKYSPDNWEFGDLTDTSKVSNMSYLLNNCVSFNSDIGNWDVSNVINMDRVFNETHAFNQNISNWDVSKVENFGNAFHSAEAFNIDIGKWNTSHATNMYSIFYDAKTFNQNLSKWCVSRVTQKSMAFTGSGMDVYPNPKSPVWGTCPRGEDRA